MDIASMVNLGARLLVVLNIWMVSSPLHLWHVRGHSSALRLIVYSRSISSRRLAVSSVWLTVSSVVGRKYWVRSGGIFGVGSSIAVSYSCVAGDIAVSVVVVVLLCC